MTNFIIGAICIVFGLFGLIKYSKENLKDIYYLFVSMCIFNIVIGILNIIVGIL